MGESSGNSFILKICLWFLSGLSTLYLWVFLLCIFGSFYFVSLYLSTFQPWMATVQRLIDDYFLDIVLRVELNG